MLLGGCGSGDDVVRSRLGGVRRGHLGAPRSRPPRRPRPRTTTATAISTSTHTVPIEVDRAWSPANAIAQIEGRGATAADPVTVDDEPATIESFVVDDGAGDGGGFVLQVRIEDEGARTVCVRDACSRVFTLAADADTPEEVAVKIDAAIVESGTIFDGQARFPGWSISTAGPFGGIGGTTDVIERTITVYANRGRTVDEFVTTILHEWGHVVDAELMTDDARAAYLELHGYDPSTAWEPSETHRLEDWAASPIEDFAEVMVRCVDRRSASGADGRSRWSARRRRRLGRARTASVSDVRWIPRDGARDYRRRRVRTCRSPTRTPQPCELHRQVTRVLRRPGLRAGVPMGGVRRRALHPTVEAGRGEQRGGGHDLVPPPSRLGVRRSGHRQGGLPPPRRRRPRPDVHRRPVVGQAGDTHRRHRDRSSRS